MPNNFQYLIHTSIHIHIKSIVIIITSVLGTEIYKNKMEKEGELSKVYKYKFDVNTGERSP